MKALVIGGTGFLGLNLCQALQEAGHDVVSTRRRSSNTIWARKLKVPLALADLEDVDALAAAMQDREVVFMVAGHYPRFSIDTDTQVAEAVAALERSFEAARQAGVRRVVYTGSVATVGRPPEERPAVEGDGLAVVPDGSTYFAVKLALEAAALAANGADLEVVVTLPTACIGPFDHKVGTGFFVAGMLNRMLSVWLDGRINVIDARDAALGHVAAALQGTPGARYILGGHNVMVGELLAQIAERHDLPLPGQQLTPAEALAFATEEEARCHQTRKGRPKLAREMVDLITHGQYVDQTRAEAELGLKPRPLAETIDASVQWYRKNGFVRRAARADQEEQRASGSR